MVMPLTMLLILSFPLCLAAAMLGSHVEVEWLGQRQGGLGEECDDCLPKAAPEECEAAVLNPKKALCFASGGLNPKITEDTDHYLEPAWLNFHKGGQKETMYDLSRELKQDNCEYCPAVGHWPKPEQSMMIFCDANEMGSGVLLKHCVHTGVLLHQDAVLYRGSDNHVQQYRTYRQGKGWKPKLERGEELNFDDMKDGVFGKEAFQPIDAELGTIFTREDGEEPPQKFLFALDDEQWNFCSDECSLMHDLKQQVSKCVTAGSGVDNVAGMPCDVLCKPQEGGMMDQKICVPRGGRCAGCLPRADHTECEAAVKGTKHALCFVSGGKNPMIGNDQDHYGEPAWINFPKGGIPYTPKGEIKNRLDFSKQLNTLGCKYCPAVGYWPEAEGSMMIFCGHNEMGHDTLRHHCVYTGVLLHQDAVLYRPVGGAEIGQEEDAKEGKADSVVEYKTYMKEKDWKEQLLTGTLKLEAMAKGQMGKVKLSGKKKMGTKFDAKDEYQASEAAPKQFLFKLDKKSVNFCDEKCIKAHGTGASLRFSSGMCVAPGAGVDNSKGLPCDAFCKPCSVMNHQCCSREKVATTNRFKDHVKIHLKKKKDDLFPAINKHAGNYPKTKGETKEPDNVRLPSIPNKHAGHRHQKNGETKKSDGDLLPYIHQSKNIARAMARGKRILRRLFRRARPAQ